MSRLRRATGADDGGFTLVELLVAMMLMLLVGGVLTNSIISAFKTTSRQEDRTRTLVASKVALERLTREVRGANSLVTTAPREIAFVTRAAGVRRETRIIVRTTSAGTDLVQRDARTSLVDGSSLGTSETIVLGGLAVGRSEAVFRYYAGDYYGEGNASTVELTAPVSAGDVRTIGVRVRLNRLHGDAPFELYQLVSIRNLED